MVAVVVLLGLRHAALDVGLAAGSVRLLRWLPVLDRLGRLGVAAALLGCVATAGGSEGLSHGVAAGGRLAPSARWRFASIEVVEDSARIVVCLR